MIRPAERKTLITREGDVTILRQCELLALCRSSLYYRSTSRSEADRALMRRIDALHLQHPFLGVRRLARMLQREGITVDRRGKPCIAVQRLTKALFLSNRVEPLLALQEEKRCRHPEA